ncbi:hypothetical protein [Serratia microhaemolytica]|uniref:hypothetical protein n=1 Tax=Serratia microhaemolytica TaxID=2675110 RepID=UPI000FDEE898|nr:hypothetical protein [Serratia microhaemolytica]
MKNINKLACFFLLSLASAASADEPLPAQAGQANNPLANMRALSMQNFYLGDISASDKSGNQFWFRYAQPFSLGESNWLLRASLPINTLPTPPNGGRKTGLGDINLFAAWLIDTNSPTMSFGFGPQFTLPTASDNALGTEKWSAGLVGVFFDATSPRFQYGYLAGWQHSFAGKDERDDVNAATFQPFMFYQLGGGTYLRSTPIWLYNFENDSYNVPLGLGIGQVIRQGNTMYNFFVEGQGSAANDGPGQPRWQVNVGLNLQFMN